MAEFVSLDSYGERKELPLFVSKSERRNARRNAKEIARAGHYDVVRRMNSLKERQQRVSGHFEGFHVTKSNPPAETAWVFTDPEGIRRVVLRDAEWKARLVVERVYGIEARNTVERYRKGKTK